MNRKQNSLMRFSRTERLAQLSEQEIVIEKKKREIQAKLEAQKKKETEEALKKLEACNQKTNKPGFSRQKFDKRDSYEKKEKKDNSNEQDKKEILNLKNAFSNDGSFLDQFKKMSKTGLGTNTNFQNMTAKTQELKNEKFERSSDYGPAEKFKEKEELGSSKFQDSFHNLMDNTVQTHIPASTSLSSLKHSDRSPVSRPNSYEVQSTDLSSPNQKLSVPSNRMHTFPKMHFANPQSKIHTEAVSMTFKSNTAKKLELAANPFNDDEDDDNDYDDDSVNNGSKDETSTFSAGKRSLPNLIGNKNQTTASTKSGSNFMSNHHINSTLQEKDSVRISSAFNKDDNEGLDKRAQNLAEVVARCGDDFEDLLRKRKETDPSIKFLFDKNSKEYISYRELVMKHREKLRNETESTSKPKHALTSSDEDDENLTEKPRFSKQVQKINEREDSSSKISSGKSLDSNPHMRDRVQSSQVSSDRLQDDYLADNEEEVSYCKVPAENTSLQIFKHNDTVKKTSETFEEMSEKAKIEERRKRKRKSRWGDVVASSSALQPPSLATNLNIQAPGKLPAPKTNLLSQLTRSDPGLIQYARQTFGSTNLTEEEWKKAEDHYKINLLYQDLVKKRAEIDKLERAGKFKYEYDSDEDVEGGTWEHKLRQQEMMATQLWAEELTRQAAGKHHIGDFLPPEELERFMEKYNAVKEGREPDLSDYKEFKLKEDNVGYRLLQKMGWNEGQGLGQDGTGITHPVNKATTRHENQGLGIERPDGLEAGDDEYDAYRKRMMLAYRFRPNPLNNPRRPYY